MSMTKRYTFFRVILFSLFVIPSLLKANGTLPTGNPLVGEPGNPAQTDSIAKVLGHCNPIVMPVVNCATHTIELGAFIQYTFTGVLDPVVADWSNGQNAHTISVTPPGAWSWDASQSGCEPAHWANEYEQNGSFFLGTIDLTIDRPFCHDGFSYIYLNSVPEYDFPTYTWTPASGGSGISPYEVSAPGLYHLSLKDDMGCPFEDELNVPNSPPVQPTASGPMVMCPTGDTSTIQVNQTWTHYQWSSGDTTKVVTIFEPGVYDVTVTNQFGCTGNATVGIQSGDVGIIPITRTAPLICIGDPDTLRVVGGFSHYHWSNGVNTLTNIVTTPGTYLVTVTNIYGCSGVDSITVGLKPTPTISITSTPMCPGSTSTLTATGGFPNYSWSNTGTTNPITVSTAGTYTVTVTGNTICPATASVTVNQLPSPTTLIAPPAQLNCTVKQDTLNATGSSTGPNFTVNWTTAGGHFISGQQSLTPVIDMPGVYTMLITNTTSGCTATKTVTVTSDTQAPPAPAGNPNTLTCTATSFNIGPAIPPTDTTLLPTWVASNGGHIVTGQNTWNPNVDLPGLYTLTVVNPGNHCTSTSTVNITQNTALPTAAIAPPSQLTCTQNSVVLDGSGSSSGVNFNYQWTANPGTLIGSSQNAIGTAGAVGDYTLLVTNTINGCTATSSVSVTADINIPVASAVPTPVLTCAVKTIQIDATASSSGPTYTYTWTGPSPGSIVSGQGTLQPVVNEPGVYQLQLVNNANSCSTTLSVPVSQDIAPPTANAGPSATLNCVTPTLNLDGSGSSTGPNFTYLWTTSNGNIFSGNTGLTPTVTSAGTYLLQVTDLNNGCTSTSSVAVMNDANAPQAVIGNPALLTCVNLQSLVDASASSQGPNFTYTWTGPSPTSIVSGQGSSQIMVNAPGVYTLDMVNTVNGCTDTESISVNQDIIAPVVLAGNDVLINCTTPAGTLGSASNPSGAGYTLQWTTVGGHFTTSTTAPTVNIDAAGTYTLLITNTSNGCTSTDSAVVTDDFAAPAANAGPTFELTCVQTSTVLQGTGSTGAGIVYLWSTSTGNIVSGGNTLNPVVNSDGTYTLLVTNNNNGCTSTAQVVITKDAAIPTGIIATPNVLNCTLTSLNLNANGSSTGSTINYQWTASAGGHITAGANSLTPTVDDPGVYTLLITDAANNCTSTKSVTVQENVVDPVIDAGADNTLTCTITNIPLSGVVVSSNSSNLSYSWTTTNGVIQSGANSLTPVITKTGIYTLVVTDLGNGCTDTDNLEIFADTQPPVAAIANPQVLTCTLQQTPVDGSGSSQGAEFTYVWTTSNGHIVNGGNSNKPLVDDPGVYNLLVTDTSNGCTSTSTITVTEDVLHPTAVAGPTVGLDCDTQTNTLNGGGSSQGTNFTYLWSASPGQIVTGGTTLMPTVGDPGNYQLVVTNTTNGCSSSSTVAVTEDVNPPVFSIANPQVLTCTLTSTPVTGSGSGFGNAPTFTWAAGNGGNIVSGGNTLSASVDAPGVYTLTIVNTQNGCTDSKQITVTENVTPPPVNTQPVGPLTCSVLERTLQATTAAQVTLHWSTQDGHIVSGANTPSPVVDAPGLYTVLATSTVNGCTASAQTPVQKETNIPTGLDFSLAPPLCDGTLGVVTVDQIDGGIGPFLYSIDGGDSYFPAKDIDGLQPGEYDLVIQDVNGCTVTQHVPVPEPPTPDVTLPPSFNIVLGDHQDLQADVPLSFPISLIDQVIWEPTTGLTFEGNSVSQMLHPVAQPFTTTEYKVTIVTKEGCKADSRTLIRVDRDIDIYAPNVIWPDAKDSKNGAFTLYTRPGSVLQIVSLQVYDRWGEMLFVNKNFSPDKAELGWPGDFKGEPVNPGVFVWWAEVELIDGQKVLLKGDVTVVR